MTTEQQQQNPTPKKTPEDHKKDAEKIRDQSPSEDKRIFDYEFSKEDKLNLFEAFRAIDADQNWTLNVDELEVFMNECNLDSTFTKLIMTIIDKDGDGFVSFEEFLRFISLLNKVQEEPKILFKMLYDAINTTKEKENDGLDKKEIGEFVKLFAANQTDIREAEIDAFIKQFGDNGKISYDNLEKLLQ